MSDGKIEIGSRNEAGFINNLSKRGFTMSKSINEIIANSIDANSKNICIKIDSDNKYVYFIDDVIRHLNLIEN